MPTARLRTAHPALWAGLGALAAGAALCVVGWYGMSGERFAERQLPYLASCTVPGAALIIAGTVLLTYGRNTLAASRVERLYELLVTLDDPAENRPTTTPAPPLATSGQLLTIPGGTLWHRADCPLVEGKPQAVPAPPDTLTDPDLAPCPICAPTSGS
ncbi:MULTISPECIES: hypothetical protein [unclassified Streptomyces]|uniref:hypothetical protein n=1 Tax=unclassified Streptomyces TaxID=2593676 RepID=UPI00278C6C88|nr:MULTISPECIES: hypothetical protein [unclassified Streptomyces]